MLSSCQRWSLCMSIVPHVCFGVFLFLFVGIVPLITLRKDYYGTCCFLLLWNLFCCVHWISFCNNVKCWNLMFLWSNFSCFVGWICSIQHRASGFIHCHIWFCFCLWSLKQKKAHACCRSFLFLFDNDTVLFLVSTCICVVRHSSVCVCVCRHVCVLVCVCTCEHVCMCVCVFLKLQKLNAGYMYSILLIKRKG